jgi:hypothetical protein
MNNTTPLTSMENVLYHGIFIQNIWLQEKAIYVFFFGGGEYNPVSF